MLYHKNGVITEDRFQKLTPYQWIFHYLEISNLNGEEKEMFLNSITELDTSIQAFYLLVNPDRATTLIDSISDMRKKNRELKRQGNNKNTSQATPTQTTDEELPDLLSDTDKELWSFMESQPMTMEETRDMKNVGKHILPTRSKEDIIKSQTKIVDKAEPSKKPRLGFK